MTTGDRQELLRLRIEHAAMRRALANTPPTNARRRAEPPSTQSPEQPPALVATANLDQLRTDRSEPALRLEGALPEGTDGGHGAHN